METCQPGALSLLSSINQGNESYPIESLCHLRLYIMWKWRRQTLETQCHLKEGLILCSLWKVISVYRFYCLWSWWIFFFWIIHMQWLRWRMVKVHLWMSVEENKCAVEQVYCLLRCSDSSLPGIQTSWSRVFSDVWISLQSKLVLSGQWGLCLWIPCGLGDHWCSAGCCSGSAANLPDLE